MQPDIWKRFVIGDGDIDLEDINVRPESTHINPSGDGRGLTAKRLRDHQADEEEQGRAVAFRTLEDDEVTVDLGMQELDVNLETAAQRIRGPALGVLEERDAVLKQLYEIYEQAASDVENFKDSCLNK